MWRFPADLSNAMTVVPFLIPFAIVVIVAIIGISRWNQNNHAPQLTITATIVFKRTRIFQNDGDRTTFYYATFQTEDGDRMEFRISNREYGLLIEGDRGVLVFQGTRYLGFNRYL